MYYQYWFRIDLELVLLLELLEAFLESWNLSVRKSLDTCPAFPAITEGLSVTNAMEAPESSAWECRSTGAPSFFLPKGANPSRVSPSWWLALLFTLLRSFLVLNSRDPWCFSTGEPECEERAKSVELTRFLEGLNDVISLFYIICLWGSAGRAWLEWHLACGIQTLHIPLYQDRVQKGQVPCMGPHCLWCQPPVVDRR